MAIEIESSELRRITNNFSDAQKVGSGGYGDVYKAVYNGEAMAVKLLHATKGIDDRQFMKELRNHMKVQHPNIVRLVGYCNEETKKYVELPDGTSVFGRHIYKVLCFEYMVGRSLDKRLSGISLGDEWRTHYQIIKGTCEGLFYLHNGCENRILHLDLKPANVLLDKSMKPKIADFGLSRIYTASRSHIKVDSVSGTTKYMPPELIHGSEMSDKTDVYGLGVTIIEVIRGSGGFEIYHDSGETNFIEDVCAYWRKRDSTTNLYQVETCAKIADLYALTVNSSPVPDKMSITISGRRALDVVIVYAFDCTDSTPAWYTVDNGIFWLVQEKLTNLCDSCMGYIYPMSTPNTYTSDMKVVDSAETKETGYTGFAWRRMTCSKNMASGLAEAHKMISNRGCHNGIILFFSDGLINKGDFFDGTENFVSKVPVHTFTLGGDAYNRVLNSIAANSPGGMFHTSIVPERPNLSTPFSKLLDGLLGTTSKGDAMPLSYISGRDPLDVVIVYAFDCTESTPAWYTMDNGIFWLLQEKLIHFPESCMGYIYIDMTPNTYTSDMKVVDPNETKETGYTRSAWRRMSCTKNMSSGLADAHKMISNRGHHNGIILFFSDGLINKGDFFDGTENFVSKVPVHTFTLGGDAYNHVLHSIATNSPGGKFHTSPVPERPNLSTSFSKLLDNLLGRTREDDERSVSSISGREPLDVVIVYAFECTESTPSWYTVDNGIFWLRQEKLTHYPESCMGYIYVDMTPNTYTSDMKVVDPNETKETGYTRFAWRRMTCTKNMASGLADAHKMIRNRGHHNGIILFFSDGLINKGDFFDGTENFVSKVPVHTFTLGGDAYNHVLHSIATNSPGGKFHTSPVPERPNLPTSFSKLLDNLLGGTPKEDERPATSISGREPLDVVIVYAFDCTESTPAWYTVDNGIFWLLQDKLTHFPESCMGYIYVDMTPNTYTSDMKAVDPNETKETGYTRFAWRRMTCTKNMASGLADAHKMISNRGHHNGIILFFSDGLINKGDFFDGTENFVSKVPVHTFTLGGDAYNNVLHSIATNSPGGKFHTSPVPERPNLSTSFSKLLDNLLGGTPEDDERPISSISGREPLDVVIVYAFDCTESTPAWYTVDNGIFWLLQEKLTHFPESCMGYIYVDMTPNTYTSDMKVVDPNETKETGYTRFAWRRMTCTKNMASGLAEAHKMINNRGHHNGIILFFSDGLLNKGDFFDGTENFVSKVPVHTFTLGGDAYNHVLHSIATNSPGGKFHTSPVPERPNLSTSFSKLLDSLLGGTPEDDERPVSSISGREPLDVVIVYAFDCTDSTPAWHTVDSGVFWLVQEKLTHFPDSCMGYVYVDVTPNTYTSDMKVVDPAETKETGYTGFARRRMTCGKNMASGLAEAHKMLKNHDYHNGIILFFSDGLINKGDFFEGTDNFISKVPVHTFTVGGDTYNHDLQAIAANSPGGTFNAIPVPERPHLSVPFSKLLDSLLSGTMEDRNHQ
ncbi:uncharacterized protein [Triticum aestivum]|uniref:uncharacterized protein isoform X1 n=1 Tax=Triticum aestivum TaxID=4565 RepID=UPI000842B8CF|nr:uncharacterized protein LOC123159947 isoform X1 [Triticum aestivum]